MKTVTRFVLSALVGAVYFAANVLISLPAARVTAQVAGQQLSDDPASYSNTILTNVSFSALYVGALVLVLIALFLIWYPWLRKRSQDIGNLSAVLLALAAASWATPSRAYFDKTDLTEVISILPNESFFWLPNTGDTKNTQVKLDSEAYLLANKIPGKMFVVPHYKLTGSAGWGTWDYYVPSGHGVIVPRAPFSREWVGKGRGTNPTVDEAFPCQSKEGLNVKVGVSLGASVSEDDAPKFLYNFGVLPPVVNGQDGKPYDRNDGHYIFASVYYARSLQSVMDDVGRKKVQTLICREIASRGFDQVNAEANKIMETVETESKDYFKSVGITQNFIGWADTFSFDDEVQKAVNDKYAADKIGPVVGLLAAIAQLKVQEGLGAGIANHGLPIVVTPEMINTLVGLVRTPPPVH